MIRACVSGLLVVCVGYAAAPSAHRQKTVGRVVGRVVKVSSGQPVFDARIDLRSVLPTTAPLTARSQHDGRFELAGVPAGRYRLVVTGAGFVTTTATAFPDTAGRLIGVEAGDDLDLGNLAVARPGAIVGRVLDEFGDAAPLIRVQVVHLELVGGRPRLVPMPGDSWAEADDLGRFRIGGLSPGDYYVVALSGPFSPHGGPGADAAESQFPGFAPTYYSGTSDAARATAVHVEPARDTSPMVVPLVAVPLKTVEGVVTDPAGRPVAAELTLLQTQAGDVRSIIGATTVSASDGHFAIRRVPIGSYALTGSTPAAFASQAIVVGDAETTPAIDLHLRPPTHVRGQLIFEGDGAAPPRPGQVRISLFQMNFASGPIGGLARPPAAIEEDWHFDIPGLRGSGVLRVIAPAPWILKTVRQSGQDITDVETDFSSHDLDGVELVLTNRAGSVTGTVVGPDGVTPLADAVVIVFVDDERKWSFPSRFVMTAITARNGTFSISGMPPGAYRAVAVGNASWEDVLPAGLERLRTGAAVCGVSDGNRTTVTLKLK